MGGVRWVMDILKSAQPQHRLEILEKVTRIPPANIAFNRVLSSLLSGAVMLALGLPMGTIGSQESDSVRPESSSNVARPTLQASSEAIKTEDTTIINDRPPRPRCVVCTTLPSGEVQCISPC
ncbi:hypothetical protein WG66_008000 [Moniliophthora roreri]|nr:hypothetical protein WG66_008000 [Moniliophthora roreri]